MGREGEEGKILSSQVCARCVLDANVPGISFDAGGLCSYCRAYDPLIAREEYAPNTRDKHLQVLLRAVKAAGRGRSYDCLIGVSGGVDSSYALYMAKRHGLRPLAVHVDNSWNSELAVKNIENLVRLLGVDLETHVIDWQEFRELQLAFLRASVVDIELLSDHAILAGMYHHARKHRIRYILTGDNIATECALPPGWNHRKTDLRNIRSIIRAHGKVRIKTFPTLSTVSMWVHQRALGIHHVSFLSHFHYVKAEAIATLQKELGWRAYGGKHYESVFTRFYQGYILPTKFGIDKRSIHLSRMICSGQITKDAALEELSHSPYDPELLKTDHEFVLKKLGISEAEFASLMRAPVISHARYGSDERLVNTILAARRRSRRFIDRFRRSAA
jgi:N-acetyl sugar amidotransferase